MLEQDINYMQQALAQAKQAASKDEVPVGAVITLNNEVIATGYNQPISNHDSSAHAEIVAIRQAGLYLKNYRLLNTTLYITLEPCAMCAGAIVQARIARVVYGATDPKAGAAGSVFNVLQSDKLNHKPEVTAGIMAEECGSLLTEFFQERR